MWDPKQRKKQQLQNQEKLKLKAAQPIGSPNKIRQKRQKPALERKTPDPPVPLGDIDIVFTWVENTKEHFTKRMKYLLQERIPSDNGTNRFDSNDELKYSIRSVYQYAPWIRKIFVIVDDEQRPTWLVDDSDSALNIPVVLVKHSEIFENQEEYLPTFNSQAIETNIHRIPDLSEHFIYSNDDMFFGAPCTPTDFFTASGRPKFTFSGTVPSAPKKKTHSMHSLAWINNRTLLKRMFPVKYQQHMQYPSHQAVPMLKSSFARAVDTVGEHLSETIKSKFRKSTNLYFIGFLVFFNIYSGLAAKGRRGGQYIEITNATNFKTAFKPIVQNRPMQFCLNDCVTGDRTTFVLTMGKLLPLLFPTPSIAETITII